MSSTINASTASGGGVITTADASGILQLQTAGTTALTIDASQNVTFAKAINKAALPTGSVLQVVNYQTSAVATTTSNIPYDDTIPQITEGGQFLSLAITPTSATSNLQFQIVMNMSPNTPEWMFAALFQGTTANAIASSYSYMANGTGGTTVSLNYFMTSGTTSATTFTVRAGANSGGLTLNGANSLRKLGGVLYSSITITEIAA